MSDEKQYQFDTLSVHAGQQPDEATNARSGPDLQTTSMSSTTRIMRLTCSP